MEAINLTGCKIATEMRGLLKRDENRIARMTEKYLEYLFTFLDEGDEPPIGMTITEDIYPDGTSTVKQVSIKHVSIDCEIERNDKYGR